MCEENERAYERMIDGDNISSNQLSNDESNINVIEQNAPSSIFLLVLFYFSWLLYIYMYINVILS